MEPNTFTLIHVQPSPKTNTVDIVERLKEEKEGKKMFQNSAKISQNEYQNIHFSLCSPSSVQN